eukprot:XP_017446900.1 PREDICTED: uncharacterized protein LOC103695096 isoform X1 [Rattus norvegicus]
MVASVLRVNSVNPGYQARGHWEESPREQLRLWPGSGVNTIGIWTHWEGRQFRICRVPDVHPCGFSLPTRWISPIPIFSGVSSSQLGEGHGHGGFLPFQKSFETYFTFQQIDSERPGQQEYQSFEAPCSLYRWHLLLNNGQKSLKHQYNNQGLCDIYEGLCDIYEGLCDIYEGLCDIYEGLCDIYEGLCDIYEGLCDIYEGLCDIYEGLCDIYEGLCDIYEGLCDIYEGLCDIYEGLCDIYEGLCDIYEGLCDIYEGLCDIYEGLCDIYEGLCDIYEEGLCDIYEGLCDIYDHSSLIALCFKHFLGLKSESVAGDCRIRELRTARPERILFH